MTPDERQMLTDLFARIKSAAYGPRDSQAEAFIADNVKALPVAPYLLAQTVLVQEQALGAASQRLQELEDKIHALEQQQQSSGSFLGGLGKSMFGTASPPQSAPAAPRPYAAPPAPSSGPWGQQAPTSPWGQQTAPSGAWSQPASGGGGSFLSGALTTAAGVAGGMLLADSMRSLFTGGHNATLANMAGPGFLGGGAGSPAGETIINNYYGNDPVAQHAQDVLQDQDQDQDDAQDAADNSGGDYGGGGDFDTGGDFGGGDSFDV
jgi:hypothetical protein